MAKEKYGMPSDLHGPQTTSVAIDAQAMIESVLDTIFPAISGANLIGGAGCLEAGITADPVQLILANEINRMVSKATDGINVNDDTVGLNIIEDIGIGGEFLTLDHTLKYFKDAFYRSPLFNYNNRGSWIAEGGKTMNEKAREKALDIINKHTPEPIDENVINAMNDIVEQAEKELV